MFGLPTDLQYTDDIELKKIMQETIIFQNGSIANQMAKSGVRGNMNYGVSLTDLKNIAKKHGTNHELARRLCPLKIREAKILASLLFDGNMLDNDDLLLIRQSIDNIDLAENLARNIICKVDDMGFIEQLANGDKWQTVASIHAIGWCVCMNNPSASNMAKWFVDHIYNLISKNLRETVQPILTTMKDIANTSSEWRATIENLARELSSSPSKMAKSIGTQYIWNNTDNCSI